MAKALYRIVVLAVLLIAATGIIGASSFTTATLSRDASIDVVSDSNGVIALIDGNSGGVVAENGDGALQVDFTVGSALGVNVNSTYELGDPAAPGTERAFNITNQDSVSHSIELDYTVSNGDGVGDGTNSTEFQVYDTNGVRVQTVSEEDNGASFTANSGETFAVVVVVDTNMANIDNSSDLSGTLSVTAT